MILEECKKYEPIFDSWTIRGNVDGDTKLTDRFGGSLFEIKRNLHETEEISYLLVVSIPDSREEFDKVLGTGLDREEAITYFRGELGPYTRKLEKLKGWRKENGIAPVDDFEVRDHEDGCGFDVLVRFPIVVPLEQQLKKNSLKEQELVTLALDLVRGLKLCHENGLQHDPVTADQILVTPEGKWGLACYARKGEDISEADDILAIGSFFTGLEDISGGLSAVMTRAAKGQTEEGYMSLHDLEEAVLRLVIVPPEAEPRQKAQIQPGHVAVGAGAVALCLMLAVAGFTKKPVPAGSPEPAGELAAAAEESVQETSTPLASTGAEADESEIADASEHSPAGEPEAQESSGAEDASDSTQDADLAASADQTAEADNDAGDQDSAKETSEEDKPQASLEDQTKEEDSKDRSDQAEETDKDKTAEPAPEELDEEVPDEDPETDPEEDAAPADKKAPEQDKAGKTNQEAEDHQSEDQTDESTEIENDEEALARVDQEPYPGTDFQNEKTTAEQIIRVKNHNDFSLELTAEVSFLDKEGKEVDHKTLTQYVGPGDGAVFALSTGKKGVESTSYEMKAVRSELSSEKKVDLFSYELTDKSAASASASIQNTADQTVSIRLISYHKDGKKASVRLSDASKLKPGDQAELTTECFAEGDKVYQVVVIPE